MSVKLDATMPAVAVPCTCMPLAERAAHAGIDARYRAATFATFEARDGKREALAWAREWDHKRSVVLTGDVGRGKTHLACAMALTAVERFLPVRFVAVPDLMDDLRARFDDGAQEQSQVLFARVARTHVLVLDDVGKEQDTAWTRERVSTLLDARYRTQLPTIVTTNFSHRDIANRYGAPLADRLFDWQWVPVGGVSMRREMAERSRAAER